MILSASRRTDIPAFFPEWFIKRIRSGEVLVRNPVNFSRISRIPLSPENVDCIVFWTKDAEPIMSYLNELDAAGYVYYFLFTLNPYGRPLEPSFPPVRKRIETFRRLADRIGKERVVWRYDPVILSDAYGPGYHLEAMGKTAERLRGYTEKCVFSFLEEYSKVKRNMSECRLTSPDEHFRREIAAGFYRITEGNSMRLSVCASADDFTDIGIEKGCCVDKELIERVCGTELTLSRDGSQRKACGCFESRDIGTYNCCPGGCLYCYANAGRISAAEKAGLYDPESPMLCDSPAIGGAVSDIRKSGSCRTCGMQKKLF